MKTTKKNKTKKIRRRVYKSPEEIAEDRLFATLKEKGLL